MQDDSAATGFVENLVSTDMIRERCLNLQQSNVLAQWPGADQADATAIFRYGGFVGREVYCYSSLSRAMDRGREMISEASALGSALPSGIVLLADTMTHSKGRFTRSWHAPQGGVWGCLVHANNLLPQSRRFIPMATGVACCEAMIDFGLQNPRLRWVNDVLWQGKKLAGFLVEGYTDRASGEEFTLIGFGINVNNQQFPDELLNTAMGLGQALGRKIELAEFTGQFLARLSMGLGVLCHEEARELRDDSFSGPGGKHLLLERWRSLSDTVGKRVRYGFDVMTAPQYNAVVEKVDEEGGLVLRLPDGHCKTEYSGEVRYLNP